jgi:cation diffusion facilitator family transporter
MLGSVTMSEKRLKQAESATKAEIIITLLLVIIKGVFGIIGNSRALIADAAYSASVFTGSLANRLGSRADNTTAKDNQSYGSSKVEAITTIIVAVLLLVVGIEIAISAIRAIIHGVSKAPHGVTVIAIVASLLVKEFMFHYKYAKGKKAADQAIMARAWEHRAEMYPSIVALVGVTAALIGESLDMQSLYVFDAIAGFFIALLLFKLGYKMVLESIYSSVDRMIHPEDAVELISTVQKIKGVINVDELRAREHGHYVLVEVKISVNPKISVHEGHDIARIVKQQLMKRFVHVSNVFIHVNPYDPGYPYKNNVDPDQDESTSLLH